MLGEPKTATPDPFTLSSIKSLYGPGHSFSHEIIEKSKGAFPPSYLLTKILGELNQVVLREEPPLTHRTTGSLNETKVHRKSTLVLRW
jgi:hypothetical protein